MNIYDNEFNKANTEIKSIEPNNTIIQNFEKLSKNDVIRKIIIKNIFIYLIIIIVVLLIGIVCKYSISPLFKIWSLFLIPILFMFSIMEVFDADKKKFKIENINDRIIINDNEEVLHNDIVKVSIIEYVGFLTNECFRNPNVKWRPFNGLGYGRYEHRKVLIIEYKKLNVIKKRKFQLKYVDDLKLKEFIKLFKN